jgi:hypothetical protein
VRGAHVRHVGDAVLHDDLTAARAIDIADLAKTHTRTHEQTLPLLILARSHAPRLPYCRSAGTG